MHVLFLAFLFPPHNAMGAVRTGKTAKYLEQMGHRVSVISASPQALSADLPLEIPVDHVTYTNWIARPGHKRLATQGEARGTGRHSKIETLARRAYLELMMPDEEIGWFPYARRAAHEALRRCDVDIILASASPATSLLVAKTVARSSNLPWVADLRDLWTDNPYRQTCVVRDAFERRLERRTLSSANALVTVSPALAAVLSAKFDRPTEVVYNGYEPQDPAPPRVNQADRLLIRYTGSMWEKRVPAGLFLCLKELAADGAPVLVEFYGHKLDVVRRAAASMGVQDLVRCCAAVSYEESLRLQREADVLLLAMSASLPGEQTSLTGKLFEYMSARRPILVLGCPDGAAADLVRASRCGVAIDDQAALRAQLESWRSLKIETGEIPSTPPPPEQFTRAEQTRKLATVLEHAIEGS